MMHWNHRVVKIMELDEPLLLIAEVYYDDDTGKPFAYGDPALVGDTLEEIHSTVQRFEAASKQPILNYPEDFLKRPGDTVDMPAAAEPCYKVVVHCDDRNATIRQRLFLTWQEAHDFAMQQVKTMQTNTTVSITGNFDLPDDDTPVAPV